MVAATVTAQEKRSVSAPWQVALLVFCILAPTEFSVYLGGLRLPPHRLALILLLPFALHRILLTQKVRPRLFDFLFFAFNGWLVAAYHGHGEGTEGLVYGGSLAVESLGSYVVARAYIRDAAAFKATIKVLLVAVAIAGALALPETLFGNYYVHNFLRMFFEGTPMPAAQTRLGLSRAASVFDHPIHLGTFCASVFALMWMSSPRQSRRYGLAALVVGCTFTALSSAPLLCLGLQVFLLTIERYTRGMPARVPIFLAITVGLYVGATVVSTRSPFAIIATGFTLDSWTGFYRLMIWEHGLQNVAAQPWLGIGLADWERPEWMVAKTIDAFWLVTTMRSGIPSIVLVALTIFIIMRRVLREIRRTRDKQVRKLARGWLISITALILVGFTVHYWNVLHAYFFFFLGMAGWLADPQRVKARRKVVSDRAVETAEETEEAWNTMPRPSGQRGRDPLARPYPAYDPRLDPFPQPIGAFAPG